TLDSLAQNELMRGLAGRLSEHSRKMGRAQGDRLRHLLEAQLVLHPGVDQLLDSPQARRTQPSPPWLRGAVPGCMTVDQRRSHRLFDRIQEQPAARKSRRHLCLDRRGTRVPLWIRKLAMGAELDLTACFF